jgi:hypothetical protein
MCPAIRVWAGDGRSLEETGGAPCGQQPVMACWKQPPHRWAATHRDARAEPVTVLARTPQRPSSSKGPIP